MSWLKTELEFVGAKCIPSKVWTPSCWIMLLRKLENPFQQSSVTTLVLAPTIKNIQSQAYSLSLLSLSLSLSLYIYIYIYIHTLYNHFSKQPLSVNICSKQSLCDLQISGTDFKLGSKYTASSNNWTQCTAGMEWLQD